MCKHSSLCIKIHGNVSCGPSSRRAWITYTTGTGTHALPEYTHAPLGLWSSGLCVYFRQSTRTCGISITCACVWTQLFLVWLNDNYAGVSESTFYLKQNVFVYIYVYWNMSHQLGGEGIESWDWEFNQNDIDHNMWLSLGKPVLSLIYKYREMLV